MNLRDELKYPLSLLLAALVGLYVIEGYCWFWVSENYHNFVAYPLFAMLFSLPKATKKIWEAVKETFGKGVTSEPTRS